MITRLKRKLQNKLNSDIHFAELVKGAGTAFGLELSSEDAKITMP